MPITLPAPGQTLEPLVQGGILSLVISMRFPLGRNESLRCLLLRSYILECFLYIRGFSSALFSTVSQPPAQCLAQRGLTQ